YSPSSVVYSPFWTHAKEAWDKRDHPNLHFVFYEDMKADPKGEIMKLKKFLGTNLTDKQIDDVVEYTSFSAMKERDSVLESGDSAADPEDSFTIKEVEEKDGGFFRKASSVSGRLEEQS
ncbi:UNVERIFIED_CONTAM: hypothetical protein GTU68_033934, partial [Idotea baltica]|nr:hypothetical protein [Idotea baltica]